MSFVPIDWVAHHARVRPQAIALRALDSGETRDWAALEDRVARLSHALRHRLGLKPGDRVALLSDGDIRVLEMQFACIRAELTFVPLNFRLTPTELIGMCRMLGVATMISDPVWGETAARVAAALGLARPVLWGGDDSPFERFARAPDKLSERPDMRADQVAMILFTSGSTGAPKAATTTLEALTWQAFNQAEASRAAEVGAHVFTPLPLFHAGGLNSLTNPILFFGGAATISARFDPAATAHFVGDPANGVTHIALVPLMYELIASTPAFARADFSKLRTAIVAGGRLTSPLQTAWQAKGVLFSPQYGGTETGPSVTALPPAMRDKAQAGSCGAKVMHVQIRLVNDAGQDVAQGEAGEIWLKGPAITRAYVDRDPALDFSDGWFRTGDVAWVDEDGCYYLVDRIKDMYKSGGENVSSIEVEQILAEHADVAEVAVIGVRHEKWGEVGLAIVTPRPGSAPTLDGLRAACEGRLARYKHPYRLELVEALPRNVTGKVAKDQLRRQFGGTATA
jgi:fatty-acyl-CoA synthase